MRKMDINELELKEDQICDEIRVIRMEDDWTEESEQRICELLDELDYIRDLINSGGNENEN
jgi:hypothetical protein